MLVEKVRKLALEQALWQPNTRILIAVSTGVDSMVLLDVMEQLKKTGVEIGVAHINHHFREQSQEEEAFLAGYCREHQLPFYCEQLTVTLISNVEAQARDFRYAFFEKIMKEQQYDVLLTAHHSDDQTETMLMKMIRTGELFASQGIVLNQSFGPGRLVRPLLYQSKSELLDYAHQHQLRYFEDETNATLEYQRNRLRHQVLPLFKEENPQVLAHFQQLSEQIQLVESWVNQAQAQWEKEAMLITPQRLTIDLAWYKKRPEMEQTFFLADVGKKAQQLFDLPISKKQLKQVEKLLKTTNSQWTLDLVADWQVVRRYEKLLLQKREQNRAIAKAQTLILGEGVFLSEKEWLGLFLPGEEKILEKVKDWSEFRQEVVLESVKGLTVCKRQAGDRISLTPYLTKKISRYFIDQKIPMNQRETSWVLKDENKKVLAILPFVLSYLSIGKETDKIHYVLLFKYQK